MAEVTKGIAEMALREVPVAVIDLETTGLNPGNDRIVEISIVRIEPDGTTRLVLDTLVNPLRSMAGTEIHGITAQDVANAPTFRDIAGNVLRELTDCVVAAYNVNFDMRFLRFELAQVRFDVPLPHFCIMYLRPMLEIGSRCRLSDACLEHGVEPEHLHAASSDALAASELLTQYLEVADERGISTFQQLARTGRYGFLRSFEQSPIPGLGFFNLELSDNLTSRRDWAEARQFVPAESTMSAYWDTLLMVLSDLEITDDELELMQREKARLRLRENHVRMLHAKVFAHAITRYIEDSWLDSHEANKLARLRHCLSQLGWAPGDAAA